MTDEKYTFVQDVIDKKQTARSARFKRTHTGKGGRAKLPSDYMTKKELAAMSGECKTYRMNAPMKWWEFKNMPDELKIDYIKAIREKYGVTDSAIAEMFAVNKTTVSHELNRLGIAGAKKGRNMKYDKEGFLAWANGVPAKKEEPEVVEAPQEVPEVQQDAPVKECCRMVPGSGNMVFEGKVEEVLNTVSVLLGGAKVHVSITWDVLEDDNGLPENKLA
jgi:hypothetical protein